MSIDKSVEQNLIEIMAKKGVSTDRFRCIYFTDDDIHIVGELPVAGMDKVLRQEFRRQISASDVAMLENELKNYDSGLNVQILSEVFKGRGRKILSLLRKPLENVKDQLMFYLFKDMIGAAAWFQSRQNIISNTHSIWEFTGLSEKQDTSDAILSWLFRGR